MTTGGEIYFSTPPRAELLTAVIGEAKAAGIVQLLADRYESIVEAYPQRARSLVPAYNEAVRALARCRKVSQLVAGPRATWDRPAIRGWD